MTRAGIVRCAPAGWGCSGGVARLGLTAPVLEQTYRYPFPSSLVGDGIALAELPAILQISGAALAPARMTHLNRDEVSVVLPADLAAGPAFALLYAHHQNEYFLSPAITVVLP